VKLSEINVEGFSL